MKPFLQLKLGQQLSMTPQLQQAIRLLQLSRLDLNLEIQSFMDSNPLIELDEEQDPEILLSENFTEMALTSAHNKDFNLEEEFNQNLINDALNDKSEDGVPDGSSWQDLNAYKTKGDSNFDYLTNQAQEMSLKDKLNWQKEMSDMSSYEREIASIIIDAISDEGYLLADEIELKQSCEKFSVLSSEEFECILSKIQEFEPLGVGARSLTECLLLQLKVFPETTPFKAHTELLIKNYLDLLAQKKNKST